MRKLFVLLFLGFTTLRLQAQGEKIIIWDFETGLGGEPFVNTNGYVARFGSGNTNVNPNAATPFGEASFEASSWPTSNTAIDTSKYIEFGYHGNTYWDLGQLEININNLGSGPRKLQLRSSLDNYQFVEGEVSTPCNNAWCNPSFVLDNTFDQVNNVKFRIYGLNAFSASGTIRFDEILITGDVAIPLPVHWLSFTAKEEDENVMLHWEAIPDQTFSCFDIECSNDGEHFSSIHTVCSPTLPYQAMHGSYQDVSPLPGWNYYRIKHQDALTAAQYSVVVAVRFLQHKATLFPNVGVQEQVHLTVPPGTEITYYRILNSIGQVVHSGFTRELQTTIEVASLTPGTYYLQTQNEQGLHTLSFLK